MVEGVSIHPLKQIGDDRGMVMHMLRSDAPFFESFGEVYFSTVKRGVIKGWKRHRRMTQNYAVPVGEIRIVIWDDRPDSKTKGTAQEIQVGFGKYGLVHIPPRVWYAFQGAGETAESLVVNVASIPYDPEEAETRPIDVLTVPYRWKP